uniref:Phosphoinositide-3-kinase adaptor protein 1 n=1 Tax=Myripristis murdjan TaxID=586833 RepID=A0A667YDM1_9TELE
QRILKSSHKFPKRSILLYAVGLADQLHGYNFEYFHSSKCIVLLLTGAFLDILGDPELRDALQRLLHPPHRVVVLLCGLSEDDVQPGIFEHWTSWRKVYADDEPAVYIATILESIAEKTALQHNENESTESSTGEEMRSATHLACLTVQPNRVLSLSPLLVCNIAWQNHLTCLVFSADMPAGVVSLTMHIDQFCVGLKPVKYYTNMGEVNWYLENATDPMEFVCQAFNITSNKTESLDDMLTDSIKSKTPASGLQLFGIKQIEEDNMARDEELPTLLHFAAKYGLKKLTTVLLQCPGALQAYSVMNKYGDYPNTLAERSGFSDLRQFMDDFVVSFLMRVTLSFSKLSVPHLATSPVYDPYGGMKTPGQRQLIALQERVKVGAISVDEAVQEFKAWQFDHERRANSLRYQQENLRKLRESITRRHKIREKSGKEIGRVVLTTLPLIDCVPCMSRRPGWWPRPPLQWLVPSREAAGRRAAPRVHPVSPEAKIMFSLNNFIMRVARWLRFSFQTRSISP